MDIVLQLRSLLMPGMMRSLSHVHHCCKSSVSETINVVAISDFPWELPQYKTHPREIISRNSMFNSYVHAYGPTILTYEQKQLEERNTI